MTIPPIRDRARHRAALLHLVASLVVVGSVMAIAYGLWYPGALRAVSGIDGRLLLLFAVVLAVGPALTWLVYRTGKRTLRMDLAVVVLIQLLFLGYACAMLARLRPAYLVGMEHHIELVRALDIDREDLAAAVEDQRALPWTGPRLVAALPPGSAIFGREEYARRPVYYIDYAHVGALLAQRGRLPQDVMQRSQADAAAVTAALSATGRDAADTRLVPLVSATGRIAMLVDASSGLPLRAVDVAL